jgi:hypothetical protein
LSKDQLLRLPVIVESFNGFYGHYGDYVLENQNRVLGTGAGVLIALVVAAGFGIRALLRRHRRMQSQVLS